MAKANEKDSHSRHSFSDDVTNKEWIVKYKILQTCLVFSFLLFRVWTRPRPAQRRWSRAVWQIWAPLARPSSDAEMMSSSAQKEPTKTQLFL